MRKRKRGRGLKEARSGAKKKNQVLETTWNEKQNKEHLLDGREPAAGGRKNKGSVVEGE